MDVNLGIFFHLGISSLLASTFHTINNLSFQYAQHPQHTQQPNLPSSKPKQANQLQNVQRHTIERTTTAKEKSRLLLLIRRADSYLSE
jgi:hypothetical protein